MTKLASSYTIEINGKMKSIKMTFGLLDKVCQAIGDIDNAGTLPVNPELARTVAGIILAERDSEGVVVTEFNLETAEVEPDDYLGLIAWVSEHVLDFFLKGFERTKQTQDKFKDRISGLMPT